MKKWPIISSVFQILVGTAAVVAYIVLALGGEPIGKWTVTLLLAMAYIVLGIIGIINWRKEK